MLELEDKVEIRNWPKNPGFWDDDGEMFRLRGRITTIHSRLVDPWDGQIFYKLNGCGDWTWREKDLIPIGLEENNPNTIFKARKIKLPQ